MAVPNTTLRWNGAQRNELDSLASLQANVVRGHGRKHVRLLFLQFEIEPANEETSRKAAYRLIQRIADRVTSTLDQLSQAQLRHAKGRPGGPIVSFMLTAEGYKILRLGEWPGDQEHSSMQADLDALDQEGSAPEREVPEEHSSVAVVLGDPGSAEELAPSAEEKQLAEEERLREQSRLFRRQVTPLGRIHAVVLIASGNDAADSGAIDHIEKTYYNLIYSAPGGEAPSARMVGRERATLLEQRDLPREHFGYPDGRSQVLILEDDIAREKAASGGAFVAWDPSAPARRAITEVSWKSGAGGHTGWGSFFVFQKWEQNVRAFMTDVRRAGDAEASQGTPVKSLYSELDREHEGFKRPEDEPDRTFTPLADGELERRVGAAKKAVRAAAAAKGASVIGRFDDGVPEVLFDPGLRTDVPNDFVYTGGAAAKPSHMRAANDREKKNRDGTLRGAWNDDTLFPRRGMPYDDRPGTERASHPTPGDGGFAYDPAEYPDRDVGLLFMAYNRDIGKQFIEAFKRVRHDALLNGEAHPSGSGNATAKELADVLGKRKTKGLDDKEFLPETPITDRELRDSNRFVTFKGGEYFFAPPMEFLRKIDEVKP